jgi:hypothetical protein
MQKAFVEHSSSKVNFAVGEEFCGFSKAREMSNWNKTGSFHFSPKGITMPMTIELDDRSKPLFGCYVTK